MDSLAQRFDALDASRKRVVHLRLCEHALAKWREYAGQHRRLAYAESVAGTRQQVDRELPADALNSARAGLDLANVESRYGEPIVAMQDDDLQFPDAIEFAYYSLYNLFERYAQGEPIDDWLIVNQALSAEPDEFEQRRLFAEAIDSSLAQDQNGKS